MKTHRIHTWRATRSIPGVRDGVYDNGMLRVVIVNTVVSSAERSTPLALPVGQDDLFPEQKRILNHILPRLPGLQAEHFQGHDAVIYDPDEPRGSEQSVLAWLPGGWGLLIPANTFPNGGVLL